MTSSKTFCLQYVGEPFDDNTSVKLEPPVVTLKITKVKVTVEYSCSHGETN